MSQWTHVSGCIRIDGMPRLMVQNWRAVLGRPASWRDSHEAENIPSGSEGSIQYAETVAGDGLVWLSVVVWGDLRDFGRAEAHEIDEWFERIVRSDLMLRAAHLLVEIEYGPRYLLVAQDDKTVRRVDLSTGAAHA